MPDDDDRSKRLLSKDAVPKVEVPRHESAPVPKFRLPSTVSKPVRPEPDPKPKADSKPAPEPTPGGKQRRRRPSTGRFKDRTLNWFKTGDALEDEEAIEGDYAPHESPRTRIWIAAAIAGVLVAGVLIAWIAAG